MPELISLARPTILGWRGVCLKCGWQIFSSAPLAEKRCALCRRATLAISDQPERIILISCAGCGEETGAVAAKDWEPGLQQFCNGHCLALAKRRARREKVALHVGDQSFDYVAFGPAVDLLTGQTVAPGVGPHENLFVGTPEIPLDRVGTVLIDLTDPANVEAA
jgi:hypothetical protein